MNIRFIVTAAVATIVTVAVLGFIRQGAEANEGSSQVAAGSIDDAIPVSDFTLLDEQGASHRLKYHTDRDLIVILAHQIGCATVQPLLAEMERLPRRFEKARLALFMLNGNPGEDRKSLLTEREHLSTTIPTLRDESQLTTEALGFTHNGQVTVIDPGSWSILYQGSVGAEGGAGPSLTGLVASLLKGETAPQAPSTSGNCPIEPLPAVQATYRDDVAPILERKCVQCHTTGGVAPWAMADYGTVRAWAPRMREMVLTKRMPPWGADPEFGQFANDRSLTVDEIRKLSHWIDQGTPRGLGSDPLALGQTQVAEDPANAEEWRLGEPDLVVELPIQLIPAKGQLRWRTGYTLIPIEEDAWVRAVDIKPSNPTVVHHAATLLDYPDHLKHQQPDYRDALNGFFTMYLPGNEPRVFPTGTGILIPKGSQLEYQIHYTPNGKKTTDRMRVALYLHEEPPPTEFKMASAFSTKFEIPPMVRHHEVQAEHLFTEAVTVHGLYPHSHYRAKAMRYDAIFPDGVRETLLSVPAYDFNWQTYYQFDEPRTLPTGTRIIATGVFDNSPLNILNPDPTQVCRHGDQENDEMFVNWMTYTTVGQ